MLDLVRTFAEREWSGSADLLLPEDHCSAPQLSISLTPGELAFEVRVAPDSALWGMLMKVEWHRSPHLPILLRNVVVEQGSWTLSIGELSVCRINPLTEWPEHGWSDDSIGEQRLRMQPVGPQRVDFDLAGPGMTPSHGALLQNWPQSMCLPSVVQCPGHAAISLSAGANGVFLSSDEKPAQGWDRVCTALQLACGAPLPRILTVSPDRCALYRTVATPPPSQLPMFEAGDICRAPIHDVLDTLLQMPQDEFEVLRFAAAITVHGKNPEVFLEMRYLLLMMCVEMLDGQRQLSDEATARMLGVDRPVAMFLNGMRNQLIHAHSGGGCRNAFAAWVTENQGILPAMPEAWAHTLDAEAGLLHFDRLYFQLCERIDAFWCQRLGVRDARSCRRVVSSSMLGNLPPPFVPGRDVKRAATDQDRHIAELEAALRSKDAKIVGLEAALSRQGKAIAGKREHIRALQAALERNGIRIPGAPHAADP